MNKKNTVIAASVFALFAGHAMAAEPSPSSVVLKNTGVTWQVNAVKDGKHALLVEPQGSVNMSFDPTSNKWSIGKAPFKVSMLGQKGETVKLEAKLATPAKLTNTIDAKSGLNLSVSTGATDLKMGTYQDIMGGLGFGADFGNSGIMQDSQGAFMVSAVDGLAAGATVTADKVADGTYTGQVVADFQATWTAASL